jgi:hypothetical protein
MVFGIVTPCSLVLSDCTLKGDDSPQAASIPPSTLYRRQPSVLGHTFVVFSVKTPCSLVDNNKGFR